MRNKARLIESVVVYVTGTVGGLLFIISLDVNAEGFSIQYEPVPYIGLGAFSIALIYGLYCIVRDMDLKEPPWQQQKKT